MAQKETESQRRVDKGLFSPVRSRRTFENVVAQILEGIRSGVIHEGDVLPGERALAAQLEVSRPTVRLALASLADAGVVEAGTGRAGAARVVSMWIPEELRSGAEYAPDADEVFRLLEARRTLEPRVAQLAGSRATDEHFRRMKDSIELLRKHADDRGKAGQADILFHRILWQAAQNEKLEQMLVSLFGELEVVRDMIMRTSPEMNEAISLHEETLAALKTGDHDQIDTAMDRHLAHTEQVAEDVLGRRSHRELPDFLRKTSSTSEPVS